MNVQGIHITGQAIAGVGSAVVLPEYDLSFDIGILHPKALECRHLFVTHGHLDHIGVLATHAAVRDMQGLDPTRVYVPVEIEGAVKAFIKAAEAVDGKPIPITITGVKPGDEFPYKRGALIKVFKTDHVVPSVGYALIERKQKLKPEYVGLPGLQIAELRKTGTVVSDTVDTVKVVYTGDTRAEVHSLPLVRSAQVLITEATYLDDSKTIQEAKVRGHTHLAELTPETCPQPIVVLCHFSNRYEWNRIPQTIKATVSEALYERLFLLV